VQAPKTKVCVHCGATLQQTDIRCYACGKTAFASNNPKKLGSAIASFFVVGIPLAWGLSYFGAHPGNITQLQGKASFFNMGAAAVFVFFLGYAILETVKFFNPKKKHNMP
jgi:hypothetical protein